MSYIVYERVIHLLSCIDGTEGLFSHMMGVLFSRLDMILIGLGWQSFSLIYNETANDITKKNQQVIITGSEAVSRYYHCVCAIHTLYTVHICVSVHVLGVLSIASRAQQKHIIKRRFYWNMMTSHVLKLLRKSWFSLVVRYMYIISIYEHIIYVYGIFRRVWRLSSIAWFTGNSYQGNHLYCHLQLIFQVCSYTIPDVTYMYTLSQSVPISGTLYVKEVSLFMMQSWNVGFFQLIDGVLYHFNNKVGSIIFMKKYTNTCIIN